MSVLIPAAEELAELLAEAWEDISLPTSLEEASAAAAEHISRGSEAAVVEVTNAEASRISTAARRIGGAVAGGLAFQGQIQEGIDDVKRVYKRAGDAIDNFTRPAKKARFADKLTPAKRKRSTRKPYKSLKKLKTMHRRIEPVTSEGKSLWNPSTISFSTGTSFFNFQ